MLKLIISVAGCLYIAALLGEGEALECYHCFDSFTNKTVSLRSSGEKSDKFVRCDKNQNNWNTWKCPPNFPTCVVVSGKVRDHTEVLRSCAERDFCKFYIPPAGVTVETCRECNTTLCNDYVQIPLPTPTTNPPFPDPPVDIDALFVFNININLNLKRYPNTNKYPK